VRRGAVSSAKVRTSYASGGGTAGNALVFPSNGQNPQSTIVAFQFTGSNLVPGTPATIIWRYKPVQQTGYYTTFFHAWNDNAFVSDTTYYGCHPYPPGGETGTTHNWEISANGYDFIEDDNGNSTVVTKGQWYTQACVAKRVPTNAAHIRFYWDLTVSTNRVISYQYPNGSADQFAPNGGSSRTPALVFGDAPWNISNERLSGSLGQVKIFNAELSLTDIQAEAANMNQIVTSAGQSARWWFKPGFTSVDDLTDSVTGKTATWFNSNKATLGEQL
jgi:hypothetical protein